MTCIKLYIFTDPFEYVSWRLNNKWRYCSFHLRSSLTRHSTICMILISTALQWHSVAHRPNQVSWKSVSWFISWDGHMQTHSRARARAARCHMTTFLREGKWTGIFSSSPIMAKSQRSASPVFLYDIQHNCITGVSNRRPPATYLNFIYTHTHTHTHTRWFKYDRDKLWLVYTQIVPVIFEPPCMCVCVCVYIYIYIHTHTYNINYTISRHLGIPFCSPQTSPQ
jgi:hypothetical protein